MFKNRSLVIFSIIFILLSTSLVFADVVLPEPTTEFYVADFEGVLSQEAKSVIRGVNLNYEKTEEAPQIVVAVVNNMQGMDVVTYGVELLEKWEIGNEGYDNGVLLLLSMEEREVRIEVGYGLEGAIPDGRAGEILDSVVPDLSDGNYSDGLLRAFYQIAQEINEEYGYDDEAILSNFKNYNYAPRTNSANEKGGLSTIGKIIIALIVMILLWFDNRFLGGAILRTILWMTFFGRGGGRGGGGFGGGGSFGGGGRSGGGGANRGF